MIKIPTTKSDWIASFLIEDDPYSPKESRFIPDGYISLKATVGQWLEQNPTLIGLSLGIEEKIKLIEIVEQKRKTNALLSSGQFFGRDKLMLTISYFFEEKEAFLKQIEHNSMYVKALSEVLLLEKFIKEQKHLIEKLSVFCNTRIKLVKEFKMQLRRGLHGGSIVAYLMLRNGKANLIERSWWASEEADMYFSEYEATISKADKLILLPRPIVDEICQGHWPEPVKADLAKPRPVAPDDGPPAYVPPYLAFMLEAATAMGASADKRLDLREVQEWLDKNWPRSLEGKSEKKITSMASLIRNPQDQKGGNHPTKRSKA